MRLPEHAAHAIRRLERAGFEAWAVGGCVRDSLRGVEPHDWDLCTSASPAQMQAVFADARVLTTGLRHGTLTVLTDGGPLEITTYRTEGDYSDGRHPDGVRFVTDIREDLARRDMNDAPIDESNYAELTHRIEAYINEFEENGTDNILVDIDIAP